MIRRNRRRSLSYYAVLAGVLLIYVAFVVLITGVLNTASAQQGDSRTQGHSSDETFRDWAVRCVNTPDAAGARCLAFSRSSGAQLVVAGIANTGNPNMPPARIVVHVPRGVAVGEPVAVYLDSEVTFQLRVGRCNDRYCEAQVAPDAVSAVLPRLVADTKGLIIYRLADDLLLASFSLVDFDKAWKVARP